MTRNFLVNIKKEAVYCHFVAWKFFLLFHAQPSSWIFFLQIFSSLTCEMCDSEYFYTSLHLRGSACIKKCYENFSWKKCVLLSDGKKWMNFKQHVTGNKFSLFKSFVWLLMGRITFRKNIEIFRLYLKF